MSVSSRLERNLLQFVNLQIRLEKDGEKKISIKDLTGCSSQPGKRKISFIVIDVEQTLL